MKKTLLSIIFIISFVYSQIWDSERGDMKKSVFATNGIPGVVDTALNVVSTNQSVEFASVASNASNLDGQNSAFHLNYTNFTGFQSTNTLFDIPVLVSLSQAEDGTNILIFFWSPERVAQLGRKHFISNITSSVDNSLYRWDGISGRLGQDSGVIVDDLDGMFIPLQLIINNLKFGGDGSENTIRATNAGGLIVLGSGLDINNKDVTNISNIFLRDNSSKALAIKEGTNAIMTFVTKDGSEQILFFSDFDSFSVTGFIKRSGGTVDFFSDGEFAVSNLVNNVFADFHIANISGGKDLVLSSSTADTVILSNSPSLGGSGKIVVDKDWVNDAISSGATDLTPSSNYTDQQTEFLENISNVNTNGDPTGDVLVYDGINWTNATQADGDITTIETNVTGDTSTTSSSYVILNGMTNLPVSGTYIVDFDSSGSGTSAASINEFSIFKAGVIIQHTERTIDGNDDSSIHSQARVSLNGSEAIEVRFKTTTGSIVVHERSLIFIRVSD